MTKGKRGGLAGPPSWSPDGTRIAFDRDGDLFIIDVESGEETRLTRTQGPEGDPTWSPDGSRILFVADGNGFWVDLYVMEADGSNLIRVMDENPRDPAGWATRYLRASWAPR